MKQFYRQGLITMLAIITAFSASGVPQQGIEITGNVKSESGETLPGVNVILKGTTLGTVTDADGSFVLRVADPSGGVLIFSFVGYNSVEVPVQNRTRIDVVLSPDIQTLEEVVVVGYGEQSRKTLTTSISNIKSDKLEDVPVSSVATAMQGKLSGVRVYQSDGGQPGSDATIRIRGGSSINRTNDPLVLIDGVQRSLNDINPNDIASIEVLKDASSTAVYGSRASNGVILVTTKRGKAGQAKINFDANFGLSRPWRMMDMVNAEQFLFHTRQALARSPNASALSGRGRGIGIGNGADSPYSPRYLADGESVPAGYKSMIDPIDPTQTIVFQDNDFQDLAFRTAKEQNYFVSASGGNEKLIYAAGLGYTNYEGISIGTEWDRFSGRANVDFILRKNLTLRTNFDHTSSYSNNYPSQNNMFGRSIWLAPTAKVYMDDGSLAPGLNATFTNPLWYNDVNISDTYRYRTQLGSSLTWTILEGLDLMGKADYLLSNATFEHFYKANVYNASRPTSFRYDQNKQMQFEAVLTYNKQFDHHNLNFVAGASQIRFEDLDAEAEAFGGSSDKIQTLNGAPERTQAYTYRTDETLTGQFGRITYDYKQKYLFGLSLRRDASSRFAEENRVGYFPGISAGWVISEEAFMADMPVSMLKLRSSWGQTGNNGVGLYDSWGQYSVGYNYYSAAGTYPTAMPNFSLGWETTSQFDIGIDLGLFGNDRLSLLADYYVKVTDDLIFNTPLPNTSGYNNVLRNIGSVKFYGWDFELRTVPLDNGRIRWNLDFNLSINKNEVLSLPDNGVPQNRIGGVYDPDTNIGVGGIAEGEPLNSIIGYKNDFIIDNQEQANNAHFDSFAQGYDSETGTFERGRKFPGDVEWVDKDGNGTINVYDQFVLGYQLPHTVGGISNTVAYKNFDLKIFMDYAIGHSILDAVIRRADANAIEGAQRPTTNILHAWQQEGDVASGKAKMPRLSWHDASQQANIHRNSSAATYRADFLCLREVRLGYRLPSSLLQSMGVETAAFFVAGQNLHYFTRYPGFVPEFEGADNHRDGEYPIPRKIVLGIKVGL